MGPCHHSTSFASPIEKTHWTMLMDNVGLKKCHWVLELHGHYDIFFLWYKPKWSRDEFNNQSYMFTWPCEEFMVHRVNTLWY